MNLLALRVRAQETAPDTLIAVAEGVAAVGDDLAAAEEEAIWDAKRNAVEQAAGLFLRARAVGRDFQIVEDEIKARTEGFVKQWEIVPNSRHIQTTGAGRLLRLKVRATVALLPVIRRLKDIADVYDDLERPRVRVEIAGDDMARRAQDILIAALKTEGFDIASGGTAEIVLTGRLEATPTVRFGDKNSPYGVGESLAACRARLTVRVLSEASEEVLLTAQADGAGRSFQSDAEARSEAIAEAAGRLFTENERLFTQRLLVRWACERQEGHVVAVQAMGLNGHQRALLREQLAALRGFRKFVGETGDSKRCVFRFLTRLDTRGVRRRLTTFHLESTTLALLNERGPLITCAAGPRPRLTRR